MSVPRGNRATMACNASLAIALHSGCPASQWHDRVSRLLASRLLTSNDRLTYINVGANKGYNVADVLQRYHSHGIGPRSSEAWHQALLKTKVHGMRVRYGCGLCNPCRQPPPKVQLHVPLEVHAIEMVDVNAQALRALFRFFEVPGRVWHAAASNFSGTATYVAATAVGLEHHELWKGVSRLVRTTTLDEFAAANLRPTQTIDVLSIDTEGQDALILEGARQLLSARRIAVLEFEFIARGFWRKDHAEQRLLRPVLQSLEANGYRCFWQGEARTTGGRLARASGKHWCDAFQFRHRSNLVCSHVPEVLKVFESLSV